MENNNPLAGFDLDSFGGSDFSSPHIGFKEEEDDIVIQPDNTTDDNIDDDTDDSFNKPSIHQIKEEDSDVETDDEDFNIWEAFAQEGIIELTEEDDIKEANIEWFAEKAKQKLQKDLDEAISEYKDTLPEPIKELLDNYEEGVDLGKLLNIEKNLFDVNKISIDALEDDEDLQKKIITNYLREQGESDEDIRDTINDFEDAGLLKRQALKLHPKLVQAEQKKKDALIQQEKQQAQAQKENYTKWLGELKTTIDSKKEIIPGLELTDKQRKDLYAGITKLDKNGENEVIKFRKQNPDFDLQVAYIATVLKGDFSKLETVASTKAVRSLKEKADALSSAKEGKSKLKNVDLSIMKRALNL
jgi:hypothetical protein